MTISATYSPDTYAGDGSTTTFAITFSFLSVSTNVKVSVKVDSTGVITEKTAATHYNVSGSNVVFTAGNIPASGETVIIELNPDFTQTSDYTENSNFPAETLEADLDERTLEGQINNDLVSRGFRVDSSTSLSGKTLAVELPSSGTEVLTVTSTGLGSSAATALGALTLPVSVANGGTGSTTASAARTALGLAIGTDVQAHDATNATAASTTTFTNKTLDADATGNVITNIGSSEIKAELITGQTDVTITASDTIIYSDASDSGNLKKDTVQGILDLVSASEVPNPNLLINGQFNIAQRGTSFTSTTAPANSDDTYLLDRWVLVSDGNDIVDVSQDTTTLPTGSPTAILLDQETANKQWGIVQILEAKDAEEIIGGTASLSFKARKGGSNTTVETLRAAIISWSSTADSVTSDVVGTWAGAGTDPTLAANWTYENTPSNLTLTTSYQTFNIENISIDTASTKNVAVFIWLDDTDGTTTDTVYITDVKLEKGASATTFVARPQGEEFERAARFYEKIISPGVACAGFGQCISTTSAICFVPWSVYKRSTPTISISGTASQFTVTNSSGGGVNATATGSTQQGRISTRIDITVAAGLVAGNATALFIANSAAYIAADSEL